MEDILYLNDICNREGMDTITTGNVVSLTMEASKNGEIEGNIEFGDVEEAAGLMKKISNREGIGEHLAEGTVRASEALGLKTVPVHSKNMEPPGYDPRVLKAVALAYATGDRGADHLRATVYIPELTGVTDPSETGGKAELVMDYEDRHTLFDTLILCRFYRDLVPWEEIGSISEALTGISGDRENMERIAGKVRDNIRLLNIKFGLKREDDSISSRLFNVPSKGGRITEKELDKMLKDYYEIRGWDEEGVPK